MINGCGQAIVITCHDIWEMLGDATEKIEKISRKILVGECWRLDGVLWRGDKGF